MFFSLSLYAFTIDPRCSLDNEMSLQKYITYVKGPNLCNIGFFLVQQSVFVYPDDVPYYISHTM